MSWPKQYGGHERSALERYVVTEEMLAGGAPVGAHWVADRQSGHQILRYGSERAKRTSCRRSPPGECFFSIGMSEPDSGSDLAAVRTRATKVEGGWNISGTKVWTSERTATNYLIALARTAPKEEDRHAGMTQFIVDLSHPGVSVRPIYNLYGGHDFNEVLFDDFFVADDMVMGDVGHGLEAGDGANWHSSAPVRIASSAPTSCWSNRSARSGRDPDARAANEIGRFVAHLATLRRMSTSVAGMLERGAQPTVEAALVKDIGTAFEREIPEIFRHLIPTEPTSLGDGDTSRSCSACTSARARVHHPRRHARDPARHHCAGAGTAMKEPGIAMEPDET